MMTAVVPALGSPAYAASQTVITLTNDGTSANSDYTLDLTLGAPITGSQRLYFVAPTGTDLSTCSGAYVTDKTDPSQSGRAFCYTNGNKNTGYINIDNDITGPHTISVKINDIINPPAAMTGAVWQISTDAEPTKANSAPFDILTRSVVSPTVNPTSHSPGGVSDYELRFTTTNGGALRSDGPRRAYVVAPNGYNFRNCSASVVDNTNPTGTGRAYCYLDGNNNSIYVNLDNAIGAGDDVTLTLKNIVNTTEVNNAYTWSVATSEDTTPVDSAPFYINTSAPPGPRSKFVPVDPARILDTRKGVGAPAGALAANGSVTLQVAGVGGIPTSGATAVVLNVTAVQSSTRGYVTVYPSDAARPNASNINTEPGMTRPNLVTVSLSPRGQVSLFNSQGSTHLLADVAGYYTQSAGSAYVAVAPARILDTRNGTGAPRSTVGPKGTIKVKVTGVGGVPADGVTAVAFNVTAVGPTTTSFVTVYPGGTVRPDASNLNLSRGLTTPNLAIVKVGTDGAVEIFNAAGSTHLLADIAGYFTASGSIFQGLVPARVLDTRSGTGAPKQAVGAGGAITVQVTGAGGVPAGATAVVMNVTSVGSTANGFVTVFPAGATRPYVSNLNLKAGLISPNLVVVKLNDQGQVQLYNSAGSTQLLADVAGFYIT